MSATVDATTIEAPVASDRDHDDLSAVLAQWLAEVSAEAAFAPLRPVEQPDDAPARGSSQ